MVRKRRTKTLAVLTSIVMAAGTILAVPSIPAEAASSVAKAAMFRLYNPNSGEHFYTADQIERGNLEGAGWKYEGIGWYAPKSSDTPVYRLYNPNTGDHHFTTSSSERQMCIDAGWKDENIGWYSDDAKSIPLYREYNPNVAVGTHNYTSNKSEHDNLVSLGWADEGIGWYGVTPPEDDSWKKVYIDAINNDVIDNIIGVPLNTRPANATGSILDYRPDYLWYQLYDVDKDGIPELSFSYSYEGSRGSAGGGIFTVNKNNELGVLMKGDEFGDVEFSELKDIVIKEWPMFTGYSAKVYRLENGEFMLVESINYDYNSEKDRGRDGNQEYESFMRKYKRVDSIPLYLGKDQIIEAIKEYK